MSSPCVPHCVPLWEQRGADGPTAHSHRSWGWEWHRGGRAGRGASSAAGCSATPHSLSRFSSHTPAVLSHLDLLFFHVPPVMSLITFFDKLLLTPLLVVSEQLTTAISVTAVCTFEDRCHALALLLLFQVKHQSPSLLPAYISQLLVVSVAILLSCLPTSFLRAFVMPETGKSASAKSDWC